MVARKKVPSVDPSVLGRRVQELRRNRQWNQTQLADAAGVSQATVSQIESGDRTPGLEAVGALAKALEVTVEFLAYGSNDVYEVDPEVQVLFRDAERLSDNDREILQHHMQLLLRHSKGGKKRGS